MSLTDFVSSAGKSLVSSAFDLGTGMIGAKYASGLSGDAARAAFERSYKAYKRRYQDTTADMKAAGLNPILAATSGFNVGGGVSAPMAQTFPVQQGHFGSSALNLAQTEKTEEETNLTRDKSDLTKKQVLHEITKIAQTEGQIGKTAQETKNLVQQLENAKQDLKRLIAVTTQQEVKANAYELLDYVNQGYQGMANLFKDDPYLAEDIGKAYEKGKQNVSKTLDKGERKLLEILTKTNKYFINGLDAIKHFLNKGMKLPKSPKIGGN